MNPYKLFGTDQDLEKKGIWVVFGDFKFKCARAGGSNARYAALMAERARPFRAQINAELLQNKQAQDILVGVYADAVILDWEGVTDENEQPLAFTRDNVVKVLNDLPDLFQHLQRECDRISNFRKLALEEEAGNSQQS